MGLGVPRCVSSARSPSIIRYRRPLQCCLLACLLSMLLRGSYILLRSDSWCIAFPGVGPSCPRFSPSAAFCLKFEMASLGALLMSLLRVECACHATIRAHCGSLPLSTRGFWGWMEVSPRRSGKLRYFQTICNDANDSRKCKACSNVHEHAGTSMDMQEQTCT